MATLEHPIVLDDPAVTIRSVNPSDADALVQYLLRITAQSENLTFEPDERAMFADEPVFLESLEASPNSLALIALDGDRIIGSLTFMGGKRPERAHVGDFGISVERQWWGRKVGRELMGTLVDWATSHGIKKINLQVRIDNERAIRLYRSFDFVQEGTLRHALRIGSSHVDVICMGLCIGEQPPPPAIHLPEGCRAKLVNPVHIRELVSTDAAKVLACVAEIVSETPFLAIGKEGLGINLADEQAIIDFFAKSGGKLYLGAFTSAGMLVGILACAGSERKRLSHACELSLMVLQAFRSNGIGSALLRRMLLWAKRVGIHRVSLHVHAQNRRAIALYRRFGFMTEACVSRELFQDGAFHDCLEMALILD